jgi:hypothetical protein
MLCGRAFDPERSTVRDLASLKTLRFVAASA